MRLADTMPLVGILAIIIIVLGCGVDPTPWPTSAPPTATPTPDDAQETRAVFAEAAQAVCNDFRNAVDDYNAGHIDLSELRERGDDLMTQASVLWEYSNDEDSLMFRSAVFGYYFALSEEYGLDLLESAALDLHLACEEQGY